MCIKVQQGMLAAPYTFAAGIITMILWYALVKYSNISLVRVSAWYDVSTTLGYFSGYAMWGLTVSPLQWLGVFLLITGLILVNHQ